MGLITILGCAGRVMMCPPRHPAPRLSLPRLKTRSTVIQLLPTEGFVCFLLTMCTFNNESDANKRPVC